MLFFFFFVSKRCFFRPASLAQPATAIHIEMQLANLSLRSERIGFRKLDNSLCYWREQEPNGANLAFTRPQRPCLPGFIFSVIVVESS